MSQVTSIDTTQLIQQLPEDLRDSLVDSIRAHPEYQDLVPTNILPDSSSVGEGLSVDTLSNLDLNIKSVESDTIPTDKFKTRNDVETTVDYSARDSIYFDLKSQRMYLYGEGKIDYGDISLSGERVEMDFVENTISATYVEDSTGKKIGKPVFTEVTDVYVTDDMRYNFKTKKALINGVITEQDGAFMHGERVKKNEKNEVFIRGAKYTTCNHEVPHYYIKASKIKLIPNDKVVSGPFNLYFGEIWTPIGFPFGIFPSPRKQASGILFPSYGDDNTRGFFVRNGGYYFDINQYIDLALTGDLYSNGSYGVNAASTYKVRYRFSGNLNVSYNKTNDPTFESEDFSKDFWINWSHSPQSYGTSRFSASVSMGSSTYTANANNVGYDYQNSVNSQFNSNVSYSKTFKGTPFNLTVNARQSQNISTEVASMTLPEISFNASRIQPFKNLGDLKSTVLGKLGFTYRLSAKTELDNSIISVPSYVVNGYEAEEVLPFWSNFETLLKNAETGVRHEIPVTTSFNLLKNVTVSPSFSYTEVWYPEELSYTYNDELEGVEIDTLQGFSRAGWWSTGASTSTRLYGMYNFKSDKIKAIRHVMTPSIGFSYSPDFGDESRGYYTEVQTDEDGDTSILSKYEGLLYGGPSLGESASVSFSLGNNIEMKVRSRADSVEEYNKIKLFENLSLSSSYNFLADSLNLSNISLSARNSFFNGAFYTSVTGTIDPYVYILDSTLSDSPTKINSYAWDNGKGIGSLTQTSVSVGLKLQPKGSGKDDEDSGDTGQNDPNALGEFGGGLREDENFVAGNVDRFVSDNPDLYVPFDVPWSLNVNYSINYSRPVLEDFVVTQTLNFNGSINLTENTKATLNSGYDLEEKEFTVTTLNVTRNLHCWNIAFNWVPIGPRQSFYVKIAVNSQLLKDLKLDKRNQSTYSSFD